MTDRELLELAARAAGIAYISANNAGLYLGGSEDNFWQPLHDDGDALRLAHKLGLIICCNGQGIYAKTVPGSEPEVFKCQDESRSFNNGMEKIRRAITRAAAEIGKGMRDFPSADEIREGWL